MLGVGSVREAGKVGQVLKELSFRGAGEFQDLFRAGRAQETGNEHFRCLTGRVLRHTAVEERRREKRMRNLKAIGFPVGDRANKLHALERERLGVSEADEQQLSSGKSSGGGR